MDVFSVFFAFLLVSFQVSGQEEITCVTDPFVPCKCTLTDGEDFEDLLDLHPLVSNGPLVSTVTDSHGYNYSYQFDPCNGVDCDGKCDRPCALCQISLDTGKPVGGLGRIDNAKYTVTDFEPLGKTFSLSVEYDFGESGRKSFVTLIRNTSYAMPLLDFVEEHPTRNYHFSLYTDGPGVEITNSSSGGPASGPFPIQRDACSVVGGNESILTKAGLMKLSAKAIALNYTSESSATQYEYSLGVCTPPRGSPSDECFVVQRSTATATGQVTTKCLGGNTDVQVTNTQGEGWILLSYTFARSDAFFCDSSATRVKIFFICSPGEGTGSPLFIVQNPLQDDCFYQFNWPTDILCGPSNSTQPSPTQSPFTISMETALLIGLEGLTLLILVVLLLITACGAYQACKRRRQGQAVVSKFYSLNRPSSKQADDDDSDQDDLIRRED